MDCKETLRAINNLLRESNNVKDLTRYKIFNESNFIIMEIKFNSISNGLIFTKKVTKLLKNNNIFNVFSKYENNTSFIQIKFEK